MKAGKNVDEAVAGLKLEDKYKDYNISSVKAYVERLYNELQR